MTAGNLSSGEGTGGGKLILERLVLEDAEKQGIGGDQQEVDQEVKAYKDLIGDE